MTRLIGIVAFGALASVVFLASTRSCSANEVINTSFIEIPRAEDNWVGFINDNKEIYAGGCSPISVETMKISEVCRYPKGIRWSSGFVGRDIIAITSETKENGSISYFVNAITGKIISKKNGIYFAPPVAIHPSRNIWAASIEGSPDGNESIAIYDFKFREIKSGINNGSDHIFNLGFSEDGKLLFEEREKDNFFLRTDTWQEVPSSNVSCETDRYLKELAVNSNGDIVFRRNDKISELVDVRTGKLVLSINIDTTNEVYPAAFSTDGKLLALRGEMLKSGKIVYGVMLVSGIDKIYH